ncbi:MAG: helix-turn-helix domain-containing protein [Blastochloris sp.]|nr:helix-turn-helix domain-containing protein [Blastochloris sp.]
MEAARLLAYDTRTIRRLIQRGELAVVGDGRLRRVPMQSLHEYQERHMQNVERKRKARVQDTGYRIQDTGYRIQDTGERIPMLYQISTDSAS